MESTLGRVEWVGAVVGLALICASWFWGTAAMAGATAMGAFFASFNLRLLIWSWRGYIDAQVAQRQQDEGETPAEEAPELSHVWSRFVLKYVFLLAGIGVMVLGLKVHMTGFLLGMGNVIVAAAVSPLLLKRSSPEGATDPPSC